MSKLEPTDRQLTAKAEKLASSIIRASKYGDDNWVDAILSGDASLSEFFEETIKPARLRNKIYDILMLYEQSRGY